MKKTKKFGLGGYTQKPTGPAKPMGPIMGPKLTDGKSVMDGLKRMAVSPKPNMSGPITAQNGPQATPPPFKLPQGINPNFKPGEGPKYTGPGFGPKSGPNLDPKGPTATLVRLMGGSSNKMGPDSMKTGVPSNPANMSIAKPPGLTGAGVTKFTGPPIIKTAKNFEGLTPGGRPIVNPINNPAVQKFTGPMSTGPRFDKPAPVTPGGRPTINPNSPGVMKAPPMPPMTKGPMAGDMGHAGRLKKGGEVKASKRADGCAIRGKTKGRMV